MKPTIANLNKWIEKTVGAIRMICTKKAQEGKPCVGFSLLFLDATGKEMHWNYTIELAFDPEFPPDEETQRRLRGGFEHIMEGVAQILDPGVPFEDPDDYSAKASLN